MRWEEFIRKKGGLILFGLAVILYANTLTHGYVQDDAIVITENAFTTQGVQGIPGLLKYDTFYGFFEDESKAGLVAGGRYRPFTPIMFAVEYEFFGASPFVGHLINVLLYALTCVLLFFLLKRLFKGYMSDQQLIWAAFAGALIFTAHPIHTEAVANIKGRDEIMALLGSLAAFYLLLNKGGLSLGRAALVFVLFSIALFSKENAIIFTAAIPLFWWLIRKKSAVDSLRRSWPVLAAALVFLIVRQSVLGMGIGGDPPMELMNNPFLKWEGGRYIPFDAAEKAATVLVILFYYLRLTVIPYPLTHDYYPRQIDVYDFGFAMPWIGLAVVLALAFYVFKYWKKRPFVAYGLLFFGMALFPYTNILFPIGTNLSERFLYTPLVGAVIMAGYFIGKMYQKAGPRKKKGVIGTLLVVAMVFSVITVHRNIAWKSNYTLFTTDIQTSENSAKLNNAVAGEFTVRASAMEDSPQKTAKLEEAVYRATRAIEIHPRYKNAYLIRGNAQLYLGQYEEAVASYQVALQLDPNYADALRNIGIAYRDGGKYFGQQQGNIQKAFEFLNQAERYLPDDYETMRLLGVAHGVSGNHSEAIRYFTKATDIEPEHAPAWYNLGSAYFNIGDTERGSRYHQKALSMDPDVVEKMKN